MSKIKETNYIQDARNNTDNPLKTLIGCVSGRTPEGTSAENTLSRQIVKKIAYNLKLIRPIINRQLLLDIDNVVNEKTVCLLQTSNIALNVIYDRFQRINSIIHTHKINCLHKSMLVNCLASFVRFYELKTKDNIRNELLTFAPVETKKLKPAPKRKELTSPKKLKQLNK